jgi:hypothetical protein
MTQGHGRVIGEAYHIDLVGFMTSSLPAEVQDLVSKRRQRQHRK